MGIGGWSRLIFLVGLSFSGVVSGDNVKAPPGGASAAPSAVQVLLDEQGRRYLAGPDGMTLYILYKDKEDESVCVRGCAENWSPLIADQNPVTPQGLSGKLSLLKRRAPDQRTQVTYQGRPLYYWFRDRVPGDMLGDGIGGIWSVARPLQENL